MWSAMAGRTSPHTTKHTDMGKFAKAALCCIIIMLAQVLQVAAQTVIKMKKHGNVYILPCKVNGVSMEMFFDTGADDVSLSLNEARNLMNAGVLSDDDVVGKSSYQTANGDISEGTTINIRKITFAGLEINDVKATIMHVNDAPLLFGQSAISKLGKIMIDPADNTITIYKGNGRYDYSNGDGDNDARTAGDTRTWKSLQDRDENKTEEKRVSTSSGMLSYVMKLRIDREGGANGANVAWHPVHKKYYAAQAGNMTFPLIVFDANGSKVSSDDLTTMWDVRGFWYNPNTRTLQANGYNDFGLAEYPISSQGIPLEPMKLDIPSSQPSSQSAGAYDARNNILYFYDMDKVGLEPHRMSDGQVYRNIPLHLGNKSGDEADALKYNYNESAIVFTGIAQAEIGLLNVQKKQIELYNVSTGYMTKTLRLPSGAPVEPTLNFSYCNGTYWLFDKGARVWYGYR